MPDAGHIATDEMLNNLEMKIQVVYEQASKEAQEKLNKKLKQYENDLPKKKATLSKEDFETWKKNQAHIILNKQNLADSLADDLVNSDKIAASIINGHTPGVYALNYNFGTYQIESDMNMGTSFVLYDQYTVERLLEENPDLLPHVEIDPLKDKKWNKTHFNNDILQGILQGESIPDISKRLSKSIGMDKNAAVRSARTATTGAQNAGRVNSYKRAQDIGIDLQQEWMATLDGRTRHSHRAIDGERIDIGKTFSNKCHYPGDPTGPGHEVYNCRCTLVPVIKGFELSNDWKNKVIDYDAWKNGGTSKSNNKHNIVNGKDISQTWKRRPDEFDFEIEDVMNAQGFNGKPRIVSSEEFDELVKQANDGNGFIAQRSYSAPDQETLDAYREQLYDGKWYVDCSTGGAQYGQGMYCAADYEGKLTDGIKAEMKHYKALNESKTTKIIDNKQIDAAVEKRWNAIKDDITFPFDNDGEILHNAAEAKESMRKSISKMYGKDIEKQFGIPGNNNFAIKNDFTYVETFTLDPSAKIINFDDLVDERELANIFFYEDKLENPQKIIDKFKTLTGVNVDDKTALKLSEGLMTKNYDELSKFLEKNNLPKNTVSGIYKEYMNKALDFVDKTANMDYGSRAALLGYDAINAAGHGASGSYTVVLNRTKLIIKSDDKKWLKNSFDEWLEDQAEPDSTIKSIWGDKKMSNIYNEIKASDTTDANKFYKELGKLGKPSEVWSKYLSGQLDADELKNFEGILKKYLPKEAAEKTVKVADKIENISPIAKEAEKKLKFAKGNPMTKAEADTYKVNPLYDTKDAITTKNCQTSAFAYECRRQGYDVAALPKMVNGSNDPLKDFVDIGTKQKKLAQDQSFGWINKKTGANPTALIKHDFGDVSFKDDIIKELEKQVGKNGERYTLSVRWNSDGAHVVNLDRDSNGVIRIIDNQRGIGKNGTLEKNTWTIDEYLKEKNVKNIKTLYRVDDCVPNFDYFNSIVVDAKKIKSHLPSKVSDLSSKNYGKLYKAAKAKGESPSTYYTKWKYGIIDDTDLDDIFDVGKTIDKTDDIADIKKKLPNDFVNAVNQYDDDIAEKIWDHVDNDLAPKHGLSNDGYWKKYLKGEIDDPDLDNLINVNKTTKTTKTTIAPKSVESTSAIDLDALKNKKVTQIYNEIKNDMSSKDANAFYNELKSIGKKDGLKQGEVWKKYLAGELDTDDAAKIEKYLSKKYGKATAAKTLDKTNIPNKLYETKMDKNMYDEIYDLLSNKGISSPTKHYKDWYKGIITDKDLDDYFLKSKSTTISKPKTDNVFDKSKLPQSMGSMDDDMFNEIAEMLNNKGVDDNTSYYKKWLKGKVNDEDLDKYFGISTPVPSTPAVDLNSLKGKKMSQVYNELKADNVTDANKFYNELKKHGKPSKVWEEYTNGELSDDVTKKIDDYLIKKYNKGGITTKATSATDKSDDLAKAEAKLKKAEDDLKKMPNDTYSGIWKDDVTLADYETKKSTIKAKKIYYEDEIDKLENDPNYKHWISDEDKENLIMDMKHKLGMLDEFETDGKKYAKLQKAVKDAQDEVYNLSPSPFQTTYSKERKDAAIYVRGSSSEIRKETNKYFAKKSKAEYDAATPAQRNAAYEYTQSYHKFNEPLRGIEYGSNEYKGVGKTDLNAKYANNGKMLNDFTDYIDKCINDKDIWLQRGCHWSGMDKFLQVDMSLLQSGTEQQLRNALLGKTVTEYGFMSCGTGRGAGFGGNVMFNIFLPKGAKATYAEVYSAFKNGSEIETIIQQGAQFTITRVDKSGGKWYIDLELSGYNPAQRWKK